MLEAYTTLGFLAAVTERVELLAWVTAAVYREPGLLAKEVTTLDVLSKGRAWLGIGAAWNEEECVGLGLPFPVDRGALRAPRGDAADLPADVERQRRAVRRASTTSSAARSTRRSRCSAHTRPILIGGGGEKKTLRMVAQYAQACNLFDSPDARPQARRPARSLRRAGPRLRRDRQDGDGLLRHRPQRREGR